MTPSGQCLTILGATGSIGRNTLAVAEDLGCRIHAITAWRQVDTLAELARRHHPQVAVIADPAGHEDLRQALAGTGIATAAGPQALEEVAAAPAVTTVITAIVGAAGLQATLAAVAAGKRLGIANKEPLVMAGALIRRAAAASGASLLPIDSEHSAIFQCLAGHDPADVERLIITGSGGPLRQRPDLETVSPDEALAHPTWNMGPKITIDSATLMNKALELIEAHWLFDVPAERIEILIHPQSIVHSLVAFRDGSLLAQLGLPDMRTPIQLALTWPRHLPGPVAAPDLARLAQLTFTAPDLDRFPTIDLGRAALRQGGVAPTILNAANELAVADFLAGRIPFTGIFTALEAAVSRAPNICDPDLATIIAADTEVRQRHAVDQGGG